MKFFKSFAVAVVLCSLTLGCNTAEPKPELPTYAHELDGQHTLRQIGTFTSQSSTSSGSYFLFGSFYSENHQETKVTFSWLGNDNIYRFTKLDLENIRIQLNPHIITPVVLFKYNDDKWAYDQDRDNIDDVIYYAVIICNPRDWPSNINMPMPPNNASR